MTGIILAAGSGRRIKIHKPKGMLNIGGKPLIEYSIQNLQRAGITNIILVTGFHHEVYQNYFAGRTGIWLVHNPEYARCGSLHSLHIALTAVDDEDLIILDSDILYEWTEFNDFVHNKHQNAILVTNVPEGRHDACYVETDISGHLVKVSKNINCVDLGNEEPWEYIGITKTSRETLPQIRAYIEEKYATTGTIDHEYDYAFENIQTRYRVSKYPHYIWAEADDNSQLVHMVNVVYPKISLW